jgi:protein-tyrosine phosphatase
MDRRQFLGVIAAFASLPALARSTLTGEAVRRGPDAVELDWTPHAGPATVRVSADPDAAPGAMRLLRAGARGGHLEEPMPISPRPYFLVSTPDDDQVRLAERLLPLKGGRNFRDLGGYRAAGGRQVRWGRLYRSGMMSDLTEADMSYLSDLGVRVVCDLRSQEERASRPNPFLARTGPGAPMVAATDYSMFDFASLSRVTTRDEAIEAFAETYVDFCHALAPQYADMFDRLVRGDAPLAMNCSAGKDRTGVAAALVLSVLGAPRATVVADYALTEVYAPPPSYKTAGSGVAAMGIPQDHARAYAQMSPAVLQVMGGSDPAVMDRALAMIDARFGGPIALAKARYGLTDAKIARLRELYLA